MSNGFSVKRDSSALVPVSYVIFRQGEYVLLQLREAAADLVPLTVMHRAGPSGGTAADRVDFFFTCELWTGSPRIMEPDKAAGLAWFRLDSLPDSVVPHERHVFERLLAGVPPMVGFGFESGAVGSLA